MIFNLKKFQKDVHLNAIKKGFWDKEIISGHVVDLHIPVNLSEKLALIHQEVSEALDCCRDGQMKTTIRQDGKPEGWGSELADIIIRTLDLATYTGVDIEKEMIQKHRYNKKRPYKHGRKF